MNYKKYSIEDFVWDEDFRQWVRYPNEESDTFWTQWIALNPDKLADIEAARQIVNAVAIKERSLSDKDVEYSIANILNSIEPEDNQVQVQQRRSWKSAIIKYSFGIAASIVVFLSVAGYYFLQNRQKASANLIEKVNHGSGSLTLNISDGSSITLEKGARVRFAESFDGLADRKIYLSGEAFFDVAKDPSKPFIVYSNGLITKVLGTKFRIRSYANEKSSMVEVASGVVAVYTFKSEDLEDQIEEEKLDSVIITRNQKANYSNEDRTVITSVVEQPIAIDNKIFDYTFSETPIKRIFENIKEGYGIKVIYDEKLLAERTLTADLSHLSLYDKLSIICKVLNTHYEIVDGKILVHPN